MVLNLSVSSPSDQFFGRTGLNPDIHAYIQTYVSDYNDQTEVYLDQYIYIFKNLNITLYDTPTTV